MAASQWIFPMSMVVLIAATASFMAINLARGLHPDAAEGRAPIPTTEAQQDADGKRFPTPRWQDMDAQLVGANAGWQSHLDHLAVPEDLHAVPSIPPSKQDKLAALAKRDANRAYNGAPPSIPHSVRDLSPASCLTCHEHGLRLDGISAPRMSHAAYASCLQCHAQGDVRSTIADLSIGNTFHGEPAPIGGERAWDGAPPVIPHRTHMREDCLSCHGPKAEVGLRTTHPERASCLQCHAQQGSPRQTPHPSLALGLRPFTERYAELRQLARSSSGGKHPSCTATALSSNNESCCDD